ncbi:hypothetical protein [Parasitella parasitica]|uniref:Uncharacterized protein n=1 Tax=Parasitella parasitica TaxID=35722 RepID=A0A0B7MQ56_9FUNG|nr:hypothetical protein [Parasitella parasitica]
MEAPPTLNDQVVQLVFGLANLKLDIPYTSVSLPVLDVLFAILINYSYRSALGVSHNQVGWYQGLLATLVMATGGGCTIAVLRGEPIGILKSNEFWGIHCSTYLAMFSNPYVYQFVDFLFSIPLVEHVFTLSDSILRALAMIQVGVEGVGSNPALGPDKFVAKVLCGTLAGCGGGLWIDAFRLNQPNWSFSTPRLLHVASVDMKVSFLTSLFYVVATTPSFCDYLSLPIIKPIEAQAWSAVFLSSGLVYGSYSNKWAKRSEAIKEINEKLAEDKKSDCGDITMHKKHLKSSHTYHVGNSSPVMDEFADTASATEAASILTDSDFLATMAQITDALQKFPLPKPTHQVYRKSPITSSLGTSQSDQHISRRPVTLSKNTSLQASSSNNMSLETSNSMATIGAKNDVLKHFSEKEKNVLQLTKSCSIQNMEQSTNENKMIMFDLTGGYYDFSSCLQSRIDAQIVELARARSKNKTNRSPKNNMVFDKPAIMI